MRFVFLLCVSAPSASAVARRRFVSFPEARCCAPVSASLFRPLWRLFAVAVMGGWVGVVVAWGGGVAWCLGGWAVGWGGWVGVVGWGGCGLGLVDSGRRCGHARTCAVLRPFLLSLLALVRVLPPQYVFFSFPLVSLSTVCRLYGWVGSAAGAFEGSMSGSPASQTL